MNIKILKKLQFLLLSFCIFSCVEENSEIKKIFISFEEGVQNRNILIPIQTSSQDSLSSLLSVFSAEYRPFLEKRYPSKNKNELLKTLSDLHVPTNHEIMLFAFQKYLNQQPINLDVIRKEIKELEIKFRQKITKENNLNEQLHSTIIQNNNLNWNVGDTIDVILQVHNINNKYHIYFTGYPASLDYSRADDTLKMKGIIKNKILESKISNNTNNKNILPHNVVFNLEVIGINLNKLSPSIKIGEIFKLDLDAYGRPIE